MNQLQQVKFVTITPPGAIVDNASYTTTAIDTAGFGKLAIVVQLGATDIAMAALKVQESDDSGMSGAADITGLVWGTSTDPDTGTTSALPTDGNDNTRFVAYITLGGSRKRYIDLVATAGDGTAGTYLCAIGILYDAENIPNTATERGLTSNLIA